MTADDFGITESVSRGILRAHAQGIVTSTSLLVVGAAFDRTVHLLGAAPQLGLGVHLALAGGDAPVLTPREVPTLVDSTGKLYGSWRSFLWRLIRGQVDPSDVRRELDAQIAKALSLGLSLTHLDSHQHLHLWPAVREIVIELARARGIPCIRVPRSTGKRLTGFGVSVLASGLEHASQRAGLCYTRGFYGFDEAGRLTAPVLDMTLDRVVASGTSTVELCAHPGERDEWTAKTHPWGYRWADELAALTRPMLGARLEARGVTLGSYRTLASMRSQSKLS